MTNSLSERQAILVDRNLDRVRALARKMARQIPILPLDELEAVGNEALIHAAIRYSPDSGIPFQSYLLYRVRGSMVDFARRQDRGARQYRRALKMLETSTAILETASDNETSQLRSLQDRVRLARNLVQRTASAALLNRTTPVDVENLETSDDLEQVLIDKENRTQLQETLNTLAPNDRALIEAIYHQNLTMRSYAESLGKNVSSISRRHSRILDIISKRIRNGSVLPKPDTPDKPSSSAQKSK